MERRSLQTLAQEIQAQANTIQKQLEVQNLPPLSFEVGAVSELPEDVAAVRNALLEATDELSLLVLGPLQSLMRLGGYDHNSAVSLHAIVNFDIASSFPVSESTSYPRIADKCGLPLQDVIDILRHAMTYRIFCEPSPGMVKHTAASRLLAENPDLRGWIAFGLGPMLQASTGLVDAIEKWPASQEPCEAGFNAATGDNVPMFRALAGQERKGKDAALAMSWWNRRPGMHPRYVAESFDWFSVKTVVDVGGSHGSLSTYLATRFTHLSCTVQDLDEVIRHAKIAFNAENSIASRIQFMEHDFFKQQPVHGADVYFLRWILHDWSDIYAVRILRALIPALKKGAWILLNEHILPEHMNEQSLYQQRLKRAMNLAMKAIQNGKERGYNDWKDLFELADTRFKVRHIQQLSGADLGLIVTQWDE